MLMLADDVAAPGHAPPAYRYITYVYDRASEQRIVRTADSHERQMRGIRYAAAARLIEHGFKHVQEGCARKIVTL